MAGLVRAASRFQEGSMNDRVSAVPPVEYIGQHHCKPSSSADDDDFDDIAAEFLSYSSPRSRTAATIHNLNNISRTTHTNSDSTSSSSQSTMGSKSKSDKRGGFLPNIWTGLREKLNFRRGDHKQRPRSMHSNAHSRPSGDSTPERMPQSATSALLSPLGMGMSDSTARPTREEVMANYTTLMAQGFFGTHAIQSTRQPPPKPLPTSHSMASFNPARAPTDGLRSNPVPTTPTSSEQPSPSWNMSQTSRPVSSPMDQLRLNAWHQDAANRRGMKRNGAESPDGDIPTHKKLRKSASRIGDLGRLRRRGSELTGLFSSRTFGSGFSSFSGSATLGHSHSKSTSAVPSYYSRGPATPPSPHSPIHPNPFAQHPVELPADRHTHSFALQASPKLTKKPTMADISAPLTPPIHMMPGAFESMQSGQDVDDTSLVSEELPVKVVPLWEPQHHLSHRCPMMSKLSTQDSRMNNRVCCGAGVASVPMDMDGIVKGDVCDREQQEWMQERAMRVI